MDWVIIGAFVYLWTGFLIGLVVGPCPLSEWMKITVLWLPGLFSERVRRFCD